MGSRYSRIKRIFFVFLISFVMGGSYFCFDEFAFFSLKGYVVRAPDPLIEKRFWDLFPSDCLRFWPLFMLKFSQISLLMERTIPVKTETEVTISSGFITQISFVEPWLRVEWVGSPWYVSKEGSMWSPALWGLKPPRGATWKLPDSFGRYFSIGKIENVPDGVFPVMFSMAPLREFAEALEKQPWFKSVGAVEIDRRAGEYILKMQADIGGRNVFVIAKGGEDKWRKIGTVLPGIVSQTPKDGGNIVVDMTYSNKLIVKREAHEGSSK